MAVLSNPDMESALLAACITQPEGNWAGHVTSRANGDPSSLVTEAPAKRTMESVAQLVSAGSIVDINSVSAAVASDEDIFPDGPRNYLRSLLPRNTINTVSILDKYIDQLIQYRAVRNMYQQASDLLKDIENPEWSASSSDIAAVLSNIADSAESDSRLIHISEVSEEVFSQEAPLWSVSTGINGIDKILGGDGLEAGNAVVIAARAKMGKTTLLVNTVYNLLVEGHTPIVVSFETKKPEFLSKLLARRSGVAWGKIKKWLSLKAVIDEAKKTELLGNGKWPTDSDIEKILDARKWLDETHLETQFDPRTRTSDIYRLVSDKIANNPIDSKVVLFVDYIQLQIPNERSRNMSDYDVITELSRFYKLMAVEKQIPIVYLAQLNRDGADDSPKVTSIKGSGSIEADADTVLLLDRPGVRDHDSDTPASQMIVDGSVTRTDEGGSVVLTMDGGTNTLEEVTESDMGAELADDMLEEMGEIDDSYNMDNI